MDDVVSVVALAILASLFLGVFIGTHYMNRFWTDLLNQREESFQRRVAADRQRDALNALLTEHWNERH